MPSWAVLPDKDRHNLVAYLKTFAPEAFKEAPKKLELPKEVASSEASIKRGQEMFEAIECHKCHGTEGRGDGPSRPELKDEWGQSIAPANLTKRWNFRGGRSRTEIATRLANGVLGTPMPAFLEAVEKPEDIWHLTNYIVSLGPDSPQPATLVTVAAVREAIPDDPGAAFWNKLAPNNILLEGQVIVDPRNFNPSIDLVGVRAVYNDKEIAFHLTWDDPAENKGDGKATFPDAISLQFAPQQPTGTERPYFLMGDATDGVYLLRWEQGKGAMEATANGPTKVTAISGSEASGKAVYKNGQYRVVIKRARAGKDEDVRGRARHLDADKFRCRLVRFGRSTGRSQKQSSQSPCSREPGYGYRLPRRSSGRHDTRGIHRIPAQAQFGSTYRQGLDPATNRLAMEKCCVEYIRGY